MGNDQIAERPWPCPLEGRRKAEDLAWSLYTVTVAYMGAYAHLEHSLRRNNAPLCILGRLIMVHCCPIFPIYDLCESLLRTVYQRFFTRGRAWREVTYAPNEADETYRPRLSNLRLFLAQVNGAHVEPDIKEARSDRLAKTGPSMIVKKREAHIVVRCGELAMLIFVLPSSVGTFIKKVRRITRGPHHSQASLLADLRILWMVLSLNVTIVQSFGQILINQDYFLDVQTAHEPYDFLPNPWPTTTRSTVLSALLVFTIPICKTRLWAAAGLCFDFRSGFAIFTVASSLFLFISYAKIQPYEFPTWGFARTVFTVLGESLATALWVTWIVFHITSSISHHIPYEGYHPRIHDYVSKDDILISFTIFIGYFFMSLFLFFSYNYTRVIILKRAVVMLFLGLGGLYYYYLALSLPVQQIFDLLTRDWGPVPPCPHMWEDPVWFPSF